MQYSPSPTGGSDDTSTPQGEKLMHCEWSIIQYSSPTEGSDGGAVIGAVVAVVVLIVIAFGLVLVLVLLVKWKQKQSKGQVSGQVNPFYMGGK